MSNRPEKGLPLFTTFDGLRVPASISPFMTLKIQMRWRWARHVLSYTLESFRSCSVTLCPMNSCPFECVRWSADTRMLGILNAR